MIRSRTTIAIASLALVATAGLLVAGPLAPPAGPVTSTFKTLTETEPRIAINATNTPGSGSAMFLISQPGSYYLTGNITGAASKTAISVITSNVTIDLGGFAMTGVAGSLVGIEAQGESNLTVTNGTLSSWGAGAIEAGGATGC